MPSLRIELEGDTNQKGEKLAGSGARFVNPIIHHSQSSTPTSEVNIDNKVPRLPVKDQKTGEVESIDTHRTTKIFGNELCKA